MGLRTDPDVLVIGAGNAGLCAALSARRAGADVTLLERASPQWRGGNTKYTRNLRCAHEEGDETMSGAYSEDEFFDDLRGVSQLEMDDDLARHVIDRSRHMPAIMSLNGIRWQPALRSTLSLTRTNKFFLGGGKALVNTYHQTARALGVRTVYNATATGITLDDRACSSVAVSCDGAAVRFMPKAVVVAAGGFEANLEWLRTYWGDAVDNYAIRGTRENDGLMLRDLLDQGVQKVGNERGFHAVAVDARSPRFDGGIVTRIDSLPYGIVVNQEGERFYDEGEDLWPKRYAMWGRLIAQQPGQLAYSIFDTKSQGLFMSTSLPPFRAESIPELAHMIGLSPPALEQTVASFNAAVRDGTFRPTSHDDCRTDGLEPPKSHWARRLDVPPYFAYPLRPGITFTYLGVRVDRKARVILADGNGAKNVFAAGEIVAGNVLNHGYLAGFGMTIGSVFGHAAGENAAAHAGN